MPLTLWHGTPHQGIEKTGFKLNKIGTGEGMQAYGWGIYFANQKERAESYRKGGQLYQVKIPEDIDLLDWDKPLSEQPTKVREAVERIIASAPSYLRWITDSIDTTAHHGGGIYVSLAILADEMYFDDDPNHRTQIGGDARAASELLRQHGSPGLRYLDGSSRGRGQGSHNYVIWDEALLTPEAAQITAHE